MCVPKVTRSRLPVPWPVVTGTVSGNTSLCSGISEIRAFRLYAESAWMIWVRERGDTMMPLCALVEREPRSVEMS